MAARNQDTPVPERITMKRGGYIKRKTPFLSKKKEPRVERIPLAILRPGEMKKEVEVERVFRDGRTKINQLCKEGRDEYHRRVRIMWERQDRKCGLQISPPCKGRGGRLLIDEAQFDHSYGRGMEGGKRSDSIVDKDGNPTNMAVCCWCNIMKGSRPLSDFDVFIP